MVDRANIYNSLSVIRDKSRLSGQPNGCPFCDFKADNNRLIRSTKYFHLIYNKFPYQWWDLQSVKHHYLLVPKRHVESLHELNKAERQEHADITADYAQKGFSVYTRATSNPIKSVPHLHTHLIKGGGRKTRSKIILVLSRLGVRIIR